MFLCCHGLISSVCVDCASASWLGSRWRCASVVFPDMLLAAESSLLFVVPDLGCSPPIADAQSLGARTIDLQIIFGARRPIARTGHRLASMHLVPVRSSRWCLQPVEPLVEALLPESLVRIVRLGVVGRSSSVPTLLVLRQKLGGRLDEGGCAVGSCLKSVPHRHYHGWLEVGGAAQRQCQSVMPLGGSLSCFESCLAGLPWSRTTAADGQERLKTRRLSRSGPGPARSRCQDAIDLAAKRKKRRKRQSRPQSKINPRQGDRPVL